MLSAHRNVAVKSFTTKSKGIFVPQSVTLEIRTFGGIIGEIGKGTDEHCRTGRGSRYDGGHVGSRHNGP